jgi:hypothetical protein
MQASAAPDAVDGFGLVDVPPPYRALAVALPTNETLVVLFADRGVTNRVITGGRGSSRLVWKVLTRGR